VRRARWASVLLLTLFAAGPAAAAHINLATISGTINPASADYLRQAILTSERDGASALLVELDTPGGLLASTKDVIQAMLNAGIPVIVYVAPPGAWAGSAGTFITLAANVAAMAPGTSIGAAHPVGIGPGGGEGEKGKERDFAAEKAENFTAAFIESIAKERKRNVDWAVKAVRQSVAIPQDEALKLGVIDLVAADREELLQHVDGRETLVKGKPWKLAVAGAEVRPLEMSLLTRILDVLATPDIAVLLILAGALGLYVEFTTPGVVVPGVVGALCLLLGFFSLQILPFSWLGLLLMVGGVTLIVAEVFLASYGLLFLLGVACFLIGGARLFDRPDLSDVNVSFWSVLVPAVAAVAGFGAIIVFGVVRSLQRAPKAGVGELVGMIGKAASPLEPEGTVFVRGEYWSARADAAVPAGVRVEVTAVEGLRLRVRLAPPEPQ
jgi:membrane-bound serine protease (ClpP class)